MEFLLLQRLFLLVQWPSIPSLQKYIQEVECTGANCRCFSVALAFLRLSQGVERWGAGGHVRVQRAHHPRSGPAMRWNLFMPSCRGPYGLLCNDCGRGQRHCASVVNPAEGPWDATPKCGAGSDNFVHIPPTTHTHRGTGLGFRSSDRSLAVCNWVTVLFSEWERLEFYFCKGFPLFIDPQFPACRHTYKR